MAPPGAAGRVLTDIARWKCQEARSWHPSFVGSDPAQKVVKPRYCPVHTLAATAGVEIADEHRLPTPFQVVHEQVVDHPVTEIRGKDPMQLGAGFKEADETWRLEGTLHLVLRLFGVLVTEADISEDSAVYRSTNPFGHDESVLNSVEDFEPYDFASPRLAEPAWGQANSLGSAEFRGPIAASALAALD
jgi:hypothetical protein